jgi:chromosome segregation ATPase
LITLYAAMLVTLGFLIAALIVVVLLPAYRHRIERFTTEALKRTLPLTEAEIRADKDRLRAEFAMELHKLETKVEEAGLSAARQSVEVNRRDAKIQELTESIADHKMSVEEHENARRVLEQAILDRLPKVEQRLAETRKLLATRDREIRELFATSAKQARALEEATQLNVQREKDLTQLRMTLDTRAARNRDSRDARADSGVALRSEIESLRAKNRDQAALLERLQSAKAKGEAAPAPEDEARTSEIKRLTAALARAESELAAIKATGDSGDEKRRALEARISAHEAEAQTTAVELAKLKAALNAYKDDADIDPGISQKADISALQAEVDEQRRTITALRAEIAAGQERLSRQALHFHEELRRIGPHSGEDSRSDAKEPAKRPLAERILAPRMVRSPDHQSVDIDDNAETPREMRPGSHLRALNGSNGGNETPAPQAVEPPPVPAAEAPKGAKPSRRPRLLERISGIDKG